MTVTVAKSLTFTISNTAFELDLDPSLPALADQTSTRRSDGADQRTLRVHPHRRRQRRRACKARASGNPTIPDVSANKAASLAWPGAPKLRLHRDRYRRDDRQRVLGNQVRRIRQQRANRSRVGPARPVAAPTRSRSRTVPRSTTRYRPSRTRTRSPTRSHRTTPSRRAFSDPRNSRDPIDRGRLVSACSPCSSPQVRFVRSRRRRQTAAPTPRGLGSVRAAPLAPGDRNDPDPGREPRTTPVTVVAG